MRIEIFGVPGGKKKLDLAIFIGADGPEFHESTWRYKLYCIFYPTHTWKFGSSLLLGLELSRIRNLMSGKGASISKFNHFCVCLSSSSRNSLRRIENRKMELFHLLSSSDNGGNSLDSILNLDMAHLSEVFLFRGCGLLERCAQSQKKDGCSLFLLTCCCIQWVNLHYKAIRAMAVLIGHRVPLLYFMDSHLLGIS